MNHLLLRKVFLLSVIIGVAACSTTSTSDQMMIAENSTAIPAAIMNAQAEKPFAEHKVVLQLSTQQRQTDVLDVANNLITNYGGPEYIDIEVVTFNEGVQLLYAESPHLARIQSLVENGVRFSVCKNTLDTIERRTGARPQLSPQANAVQAGVARIITLVENGYVNVKP